jgi:predicted transcriptional regulator
MLFKDLASHTVQCYRNSTKCKVCGDIITKDKKKEHLQRWRDEGELKTAIIED